MYIERLVLEVTRRCNMSCAHCLRGDAQNLDMSKEIIDKLLEEVNSIYEITFTGGEPTLNVSIMEYFLDSCIKKNIPISNFYIVTNALEVPIKFREFLLHLFDYCYEFSGEDIFEMSAICPSVDMYHLWNPVIKDNINKLKAFKFYREDKMFWEDDGQHILEEGRAKNLKDVKFANSSYCGKYYEIEEDDNGSINVNGNEVYISANGEVRANCDVAYDNTTFTIGNIMNNSLKDIILNATEFIY